VEWSVVRRVVVGILVGTLAGSWIAAQMSTGVLKIFFVIFLLRILLIIISIPEKQLVIVRTGSGTLPNWKNTTKIQDDALEGHYQELPAYISIGMSMLALAGGN
jgi:uncharacterized membrane protein YfcA